MTKSRIEHELNFNLEAEFKAALESFGAARTLARVELTVLQRTARGEFLEGSSPGAGQYSTKPFARPAGGLSSTVYQKLQADDSTSEFFTKGGALWLVIEGGYKYLRQEEGYQVDHVDLYKRGDLLGAMRSRTKRDAGSLTMEYGYLSGLSDVEATQIADFHNRLGAGKSKQIRRYVGLSDKEKAPIVADASDEMTKSLGLE